MKRWLSVNAENEASSVASRPSYFNRVRRLDPPRDRLASSLFHHVSLRSPQGRTTLQDMITYSKLITDYLSRIFSERLPYALRYVRTEFLQSFFLHSTQEKMHVKISR
jgi:hypothetical protein